MVENESPGDLQTRLAGLESQVAKLTQEIAGLSAEIKRQNKLLSAVTGWHPALLILVVLTFGFMLALCLMSGFFHWGVSLGLAAAVSILVYLPFRGRTKAGGRKE